jgi:1-acyl-sn-glycerol-3-phosphate acyltransferase
LVESGLAETYFHDLSTGPPAGHEDLEQHTFWRISLAAIPNDNLFSSAKIPSNTTGSERPSTLCKLTGHTIALAAKFVSGFTVRWRGAEPSTRQRVYFANHTSHLDAVVLWSCLPKDLRQLTRPVAAQDYWGSSKFRRFLAQSFNAILIDRKQIKVHQSPVEVMLREIGDLYSLIVFPEGSRAQTGEMGEFKSGLYYLAKKRPDLELIPVYMDNLNRILPRGEVVPVPLLSSITIGNPIYLEPGEPKLEFLDRAARSVKILKER